MRIIIIFINLMKNKLTAIIPVRKGSQRVKNKNIKPFADSNLLKLKIEMIKSLDKVDQIIVDSDSDDMLDIGIKCGVGIKKREDYYASSECTNSEYHEYLGKSTDSEDILIAQVTAPLISKETFEKCIDKYFNNNCDSLMTVQPVKSHLWLDGKPLNYEVGSAPNSQDLPNIQKLTFGVVLCKGEVMVERKNMVGYNPYFYELDEIESLDIDTEFDFEVCEYFYNRKYK